MQAHVNVDTRVERAAALPAHHRHEIGVGPHDVGHGIAVEVDRGDRSHEAGRQIGARAEPSRAVPAPHRDGVVGPRHDVEMPVQIDVGERHGARAGRRRVRDVCPEAGIAVADQHRDAGLVVARVHDVEPAVAVQVAGHERAAERRGE